MKNTMILAAFLLIITLSNGSIATIKIENNLPVPEVIACENKGTCEMTRLNELTQSK